MRQRVFSIASVISFVFILAAPGMDFSQKNGAEEEIERINQQIQLQGLQWEAGRTSLSGLSKMERLSRLGAFLPMQADPDRMLHAQAVEDLPSVWNWTAWNGGNYITTVKDQGSCGSCWAFATIGVMEAVYNVENIFWLITASQGSQFIC